MFAISVSGKFGSQCPLPPPWAHTPQSIERSIPLLTCCIPSKKDWHERDTLPMILLFLWSLLSGQHPDCRDVILLSTSHICVFYCCFCLSVLVNDLICYVTDRQKTYQKYQCHINSLVLLIPKIWECNCPGNHLRNYYKWYWNQLSKKMVSKH